MDVARLRSVDGGHARLRELAVGDDEAVGGDDPQRARTAEVAVDRPVARGVAELWSNRIYHGN